MKFPHYLSFDEKDWLSWLKDASLSDKSLSFALDYFYRNKKTANLPQDFDFRVKKSLCVSLPKVSHIKTSEDSTTKFLIEFKDGYRVETVLIPFNKKPTICLSTQVGCAMNCSFCYTGTQGLKRNLLPEEIIGQYLTVTQWMNANQNIFTKPNIVFMGQGEPFHNWVNVLKSINIFLHPKMVGLGPRQITLSTSGYLPSHELTSLPPINYALSLHSPFQEQRSQLIPINQKYPLADVIKRLDQIKLLPRQFINYEYLLIKDFNMSDQHVKELTNLLSQRKAIVNLIPFNPFPRSHFQRPSRDEIDTFKEKLVANKLRVMIRTTKGDDILAACGQLKVEEFSRKKNV